MAERPETISKIAVRGFKSIADEQQIELRPLTLLAGANSSGKSSLMQPVLLLKQTLESPSDPGALLLDGPNVCFTSAEQLFSRIITETQELGFAVGVGLSDGPSIQVRFTHREAIGFEIDEMICVADGERIRITANMAPYDILNTLPSRFAPYKGGVTSFDKGGWRWFVHRDRCFLSLRSTRVPSHALDLRLFTPGFSPSDQFVPHLQRMIHLPGLRGNPQRTYPKRVAGPLFPGLFQDYVASIVSQWQSKGDSRLHELGKALEIMGLTWTVEAKPVDDTRVELRVGRVPHSRPGENHDLVSIADVGFGVSQSLPVVVALVVAEPGQVVYLEQPEIHLHPRAQRRLAHVLADAANRGVIVVAETHSALLLREVQTLVATNKLSADKVKLHWFQRQEDGRTVVTPAELDENGAYGDWPEDFDEVELNAEKDYLDAVEKRGAGE